MSKKTKKEMPVPALAAPMLKRLLAFLLDWYLGGVLSMMPVAFLWNMRTGETKVNLNIVALGRQGIYAALAAILLLIVYFYVIPWLIWPGQTIGKRILSIAVVDKNGSSVPAGRLAVRQIGILLFLETMSLMTGNPILSLFTLLFNEQVSTVLSYASMVLLAISVLMCSFSRQHQALHDWLTGTEVVVVKRANAVY